MIKKVPRPRDEFIINSSWFELNTIFQQTFPNLKAGNVYEILGVEYFEGDISNWGITEFKDGLSGELFSLETMPDFWCMFGPNDPIRILK